MLSCISLSYEIIASSALGGRRSSEEEALAKHKGWHMGLRIWSLLCREATAAVTHILAPSYLLKPHDYAKICSQGRHPTPPHHPLAFSVILKSPSPKLCFLVSILGSAKLNSRKCCCYSEKEGRIGAVGRTGQVSLDLQLPSRPKARPSSCTLWIKRLQPWYDHCLAF